jgi:hypothetical protein
VQNRQHPIRQTEILEYVPVLRSRFDAPLPEEQSFGDEVNERAFKVGRTLLSQVGCPFCGAQLNDYNNTNGMAMNRGWATHLKSCNNCGWWCADEMNTPVGGEPDSDFSEETWGYIALEGTIRRFKADDLTLPVALLRDYARRHSEILYQIHPRKFEELLASILSDFFECEVTLTGQTVDGGVDMYLVRGNETYLVQAKRRSKPGSTEGVQVVRELAGVMLMSGYRSGIVVSTAEEYSLAAQREASSPFLAAQGYSLELMNCRELLDALRCVAQKENHLPAWAELKERPFMVSSLRHLVDT